MTAHVVHELPVLVDGRGRMYSARVLGELVDDGSWDGAIEFMDEGGRTYMTGVETHQPSLTDLIYWSTALSRRDVQGALVRARAPKKAAHPAPRAMRGRRPTTRRVPAEKQSATRTRRAAGTHARSR
jgi:hypothetical protein